MSDVDTCLTTLYVMVDDFCRLKHLRAAFPQLPDRDAITAFGLHLVARMRAQGCSDEVLDSTAAVTRDAKRRGLGWRAWQAQCQVDLVTPPHQHSKRICWPEAVRRLLAHLRQIIETVNDKLLHPFRLARERPHDLTGFQARLAAKVSLHNVCLWFNLHLSRAPLAKARLARLVNPSCLFSPSV